jgi:hypothetical protein
MTSRDRREELRANYEQRPRDAGVYALRNTATGRVLIASSVDLASIRNRLDFGKQTNSTGVLDRRLIADAKAHGMESFELEVLDTLDADPLRTDDQSLADLATLEDLWRDKLEDEPAY